MDVKALGLSVITPSMSGGGGRTGIKVIAGVRLELTNQGYEPQLNTCSPAV